jgi:hypothetical protein
MLLRWQQWCFTQSESLASISRDAPWYGHVNGLTVTISLQFLQTCIKEVQHTVMHRTAVLAFKMESPDTHVRDDRRRHVEENIKIGFVPTMQGILLHTHTSVTNAAIQTTLKGNTEFRVQSHLHKTVSDEDNMCSLIILQSITWLQTFSFVLQGVSKLMFPFSFILSGYKHLQAAAAITRYGLGNEGSTTHTSTVFVFATTSTPSVGPTLGILGSRQFCQ